MPLGAAGAMPVRLMDPPSSLLSRGLLRVLRVALGRPLRHDTDITVLRRRYEAFDASHVRVGPDVQRTAVNCHGVPAEWISVPGSRPDRTLLLLHGGSFAFRFPNTHAAFAARLCRRLQARALVPDYRLVPEHPFPAAPDDCQAVYRWLLANGCDPAGLVLVGDSAGGNLVLVTLHRCVREGDALPACAVLLSPAVDCTLESRSMFENDAFDPVVRLANLLLLRRHYVPTPQLYTDPDVSPLFADFTRFPPLFLQAGRTELLRDEAVRTAEKAHAAGVDVELELWPDTVHGFQLAAFLPESQLALSQIVGFVAARTGWVSGQPAIDPAPGVEQAQRGAPGQA
ncbi:MAG: alpha/beta hydrolase [Leptothrix sp. (in: Bacteria)]|nr:alpha/beta hydrolase [Leptothrix sp. (in: b-proteobacteria)]